MPDVAAWERMEGLHSVVAARAIARADAERWVPGLPARGTYQVLGLATVAAILADIALGLLPPSGGVDVADHLLRYGTAGLGVLAAGWSILSEIRGWEGSDAATWFLKRRIDRTRKRLDARRHELEGIAIAVGPAGLSVYREAAGAIAREALEPVAIPVLELDDGTGTMTLHATTALGTRSFGWLPRHRDFEAAVALLAGAIMPG